MGDLHFSQGDGEITFCGAIEMAGWLHLKVDIIKDGVAKYGIKNPVFKPSPVTPNYKDYLIFEGISVDEQGKQHYLDVHIAYRQACLNAIEYLKKFGYSGAQAYSDFGNGAVPGPHLRRGRRAQCLCDAVAADGNFRLRHHAVVGWSDQTHQGRHPDAAVTGQIAPRATGCGTARLCRPASAVANGLELELARGMKMPVYEYLCNDCGPFTDMRPMAEMRCATGLSPMRSRGAAP